MGIRTVAAAGLAAALVASARADIGPQIEFGTTLAPWKGSGIRMEREDVVLRLERDRVLVKATFVLVNGEKPVKLPIGFPDVVQARDWSEDVRKPPTVGEPRVRDFRVAVDGRPLATGVRFYRGYQDHGAAYRKWEQELEAARTPEERERLRAALDGVREDMRWWSGIGWLVFDAELAARQRRTVVVSYWSPYQPAFLPDQYFLGWNHFLYVLRTGAPWEGTIGEAVVDVELGEGVTHRHVEQVKPAGAVRTEKGMRWTFRDFEPTEDIDVVVRTYIDAADAARGYLAAADAARANRDLRSEGDSLVGAWTALSQERRWPEAVDACRRLIVIEKALRDGRPSKSHPLLRLGHYHSYVPWEWRLVQSLENAGRADEARAAAAAALPYLRSLKEAEPDEMHRPEVERAIVRCEELAKGAPAR